MVIPLKFGRLHKMKSNFNFPFTFLLYCILSVSYGERAMERNVSWMSLAYFFNGEKFGSYEYY